MKSVTEQQEELFWKAMDNPGRKPYVLVLERTHGSDVPTFISSHNTWGQAKRAMARMPMPEYVDMEYNIY